MAGFVPLGDASRRPAHYPVITLLIILVNSYVFLLELGGGDRFVYKWSAIPVLIVFHHRWITLFTSMFMHGGWLHIVGNMIYLWAFGPAIEDAMGRGRYLLFYFAGGLIAMSAQVFANPYSDIPNLGASGAIATVMGAFIVTYPRDRIRSLFFILIIVQVARIPAALLIGFWFLMQLVHVGPVANVQTGGVAYIAHVAGFIFGVVTARFFSKPNRNNWRMYSN